MKRKQAEELILELVGELDYDLAKTFDPECSEEPEEIPARMQRLVAILADHGVEVKP